MDLNDGFRDMIWLWLFVALSLPNSAYAERGELVAISQPPPTKSDSFPLVVIHRPSILPTSATLLTLEGGGGALGLLSSTSYGLGLGASSEILGKINVKQFALSSYELGFGKILYQTDPFEVVGRVSLPVYQEATRFQDVSFGPAISYTVHSRWVISALTNLVHLRFAPATALQLFMNLSLGFQPWDRWHFSLTSDIGEIGVLHASSHSLICKAPFEGAIQFAGSRTWDMAIKVTGEYPWKPLKTWNLALLLTLKRMS